jgi:hypothetical protein
LARTEEFESQMIEDQESTQNGILEYFLTKTGKNLLTQAFFRLKMQKNAKTHFVGIFMVKIDNFLTRKALANLESAVHQIQDSIFWARLNDLDLTTYSLVKENQ